MKFRLKPTEVEAVLFSYTPTGLAALMALAGDDLSAFSKPRTPGGKATANVAGRVVNEGEYLVKISHDYDTMSRESFERRYEPVTATPAATPVTAEPALVKYPSIRAATEAAAKRGDTSFTYHMPCVNGHTTPRSTRTGNCIECMKGHARRYAAKATKVLPTKVARMSSPSFGGKVRNEEYYRAVEATLKAMPQGSTMRQKAIELNAAALTTPTGLPWTRGRVIGYVGRVGL